MRYLVTGAAGFVGARFVESCGKRGIPVVSVDHLSHFTSRTEHRGIAFNEIIDRDKLFEWNGPISAIVHLGACTDTTQLDEKFLTRVNLEYSKQIWNLAIARRIPLVYASSAATYGDGALGYSDDEAKMASLHPLNPYGDSKLRFDLWALEQERAGKCPPSWAGFKFFNVYGFGERHKGHMASVVLHAFDQIRKSGQVRLFKSHRAGIADGEQKRDFIYVDDVVAALHFALEKPIHRGIFNLGTGQARSFHDLVRATFTTMQKPESIEYIDTPEEIRERYQYFTQAEMSRLRAEGFDRPFTSLEKGVEAYVTRLITETA
jgi:ADP-L-glycero-D-manno-heptose 6-epimerase